MTVTVPVPYPHVIRKGKHRTDRCAHSCRRRSMRTRCRARRKRDRDSQGSRAHAGGPAPRAQADASLPDDDPSTDAQAQLAGGVVSATPAKREPGSVEQQAHQASGIAPLDGTVSPAGSRSASAPPRQLVGRLVRSSPTLVTSTATSTKTPRASRAGCGMEKPARAARQAGPPPSSSGEFKASCHPRLNP